MELRNIKLPLSLVIIIFVLFISQSAFATATVNISAYISNLQVTPINPDQPDFRIDTPDGSVSGHAQDSMGNEGWCGGMDRCGGPGPGPGAWTPYANQQSLWGPGTTFETSSFAIANPPNMWAKAWGYAMAWKEISPVWEEDVGKIGKYLLSFDYGFSVFGYSDSDGHFDSSFDISIGPGNDILWSLSGYFSGTNEIIDESDAGHIDGIPVEGWDWIDPYVETYAYAENIPEPSTMLLLGSGLLGLWGFRRKFKK